MNLCTPDRVRSFGVDVAKADDLIGRLIVEVSAQVERHLDRGVEIKTREDLLDIEHDGQRILYLSAFPTSSITDIRYDPDGVFGDGSILSPSLFRLNPMRGSIHLLQEYRAHPLCFRVSHIGGMALDTNDFETKFPDLSGQVAMQVYYLYQRRNQLGVISVSGEGGAVTLAPVDLLPSLRSAIRYHKRA